MRKEIEEYILEAGSDSLSVFGGKYVGGIYLQQVPDELAACIDAIQGNIESYLEIGSASGGTAYIFYHFFQPFITLVDDNKHIRAKLRSKILAGIPRRELIGKSDDKNIIKAASEKTYDIILIDGDHLYEPVKKDTQNYLPLLNENGYILYHDSLLKNWGVKKLVKELKKDSTLEFIDEFKSKKYKPLGLAMFRRKECK